MQDFKSTLNKIIGEQLPIRQRFFNIIFICGFLIGIMGVLACISLNSSHEAITISAVMTLILPLLAIIGINVKQRQNLIITISLIAVNFIIFPALYLTGGGIECGIPSYFVIGLALTLFLIKEKSGIILTIIESVFYMFVFYLSYRFPNILAAIPACATKEGAKAFTYTAISSNAAMVSIALAILAKILFSMYRKENAVVTKSIQEVKRQSTIDPLTNVYNRRFMYTYLSKQFEIANKEHSTFSIVMFDIDKFKKLNDTYGHLTGDEVLKAVARILRNSCRKGEIVARYGGEEFLLILPNLTKDLAYERADEIRTCIAESLLSPDLPKEKPVTISGGIAEFNIELTEEKLVEKADERLYFAKENGRNRICK